MSFLTAIFGGLGGYQQGRAQREQTQFEQNMTAQTEADRQQQLAIQQGAARESMRAIMANQGMDTSNATWDPTTQSFVGAKPFTMPQPLTRVVPHPVGPNYQVTPMDQYSHLMGLASWYARTGQTTSADIAGQQAADIYNQMSAEETERLRLQDQLTEIGARGALTQQLYSQYGAPGTRMTPLTWEELNYLHQTGGLPGHAGTSSNPQVINLGKQVTQLRSQASTDEQAYKSQYANAIKVTKDPITGMPLMTGGAMATAPLPADQQQQYNTIAQELMTAKDPETLADQVLAAAPKSVTTVTTTDPKTKKQVSGPSTFTTLVRSLAKWQASERAYQSTNTRYGQLLKSSAQPTSGTGFPIYVPGMGYTNVGGSNATRNPTQTRSLAPASIWQMLVDQGATPDEATTLTAIAMAESGGNAGSVNPHDNNGKQTSWGLFQISDGTHNEPAGWNDPVTNARMALEKLRTQGYKAWGTYNTGKYRQYLPGGPTSYQAPPAAGLPDPATVMLMLGGDSVY